MVNENVNALVCGGAGFMGSNFIRYILRSRDDINITNFDALTYAGNLSNLYSVKDNARYNFVKGDIRDKEQVMNAVERYNISLIINFAAESHVDRSIDDPDRFADTNIRGVMNLLDVTKEHDIRLIQISTDEVYGSTEKGSFTEESPFRPNNPYSASKASGDLLCRSYYKTYGTDVIVTHSANNFGPYQYPEKVIPLFITNILENMRVPLYGNGLNTREWIYVHDHSSAISTIIDEGNAGDVFNIGSGSEINNLALTKLILNKLGKDASWIEYVEDRKGHDMRYSLDCTRLRSIGWKPRIEFEKAIDQTIDWYLKNQFWWRPLK